MSRAQPWPETVTVLRTIGTALATKRWIWRAALGEWSKVSYQAGARFHPQEYSVSSLRELAVIWQALDDLLTGTETHTGRLEIGTRTDAAGSSRVVLLHTRRHLQEAVTAGPVLVLDATMPIRIVRHYLPRLEVLADLQAAAPSLDTFQIVGGWGKTSMIPSSRASRDENIRREGVLQELRDFVVFHSGGNALVVTYDAIEDHFSNLPGVRTGHFNKIAGLDTFGDV
jgi:hypothetical protein